MTRSFSISSIDNEKTGPFLERLSQEIISVEDGGGKILNIALRLPDEITENDDCEATVYYTHSKQQDYSMRVMEVRKPFKNQAVGLQEVLSKCNVWLENQEKSIIHDLQFEFLTDQKNGNSQLVVRIFYSHDND